MPAQVGIVLQPDLVRLNGLRTIPIDVVTTTNAVQTIRLGVVNANGDAISYQVRLVGMRDDGEMMARLTQEGNGARNPQGNGIGTWVALGPSGSTDDESVPWTTSGGLPTNWGIAVAFATNTLNLTFNADTGQTVRWRGWVMVQLHGGATA